MIFTDRKITIRNGKSTINEPVILYRGDYEVSIKFTIMESKFRFKSGVNLVDSEKASHGQLAILTPYGGNVFSEIVKCEDGTVTFTLTEEMIDQLEEVGLYSFQIRLFDYYRESRVTIPPVEFGIEVREPIASEDHDNELNNAIVGYSVAKYLPNKISDGLNEYVPDTFDDDGNYNKTEWETGDRISEGRLNKIEDALDKINQNEKNDIAAMDKKVNSNFNVLSSEIDTKADDSFVQNLSKSIGNGGPKGVYATVAALTSAKPKGDSNVYVVSADGCWYFWSGSAWTKGGIYQSTGISDGSISYSMLNAALQSNASKFADFHIHLPYSSSIDIDEINEVIRIPESAIVTFTRLDGTKSYSAIPGAEVSYKGILGSGKTYCGNLIYNVETRTWSMARHDTTLSANDVIIASIRVADRSASDCWYVTSQGRPNNVMQKIIDTGLLCSEFHNVCMKPEGLYQPVYIDREAHIVKVPSGTWLTVGSVISVEAHEFEIKNKAAQLYAFYYDKTLRRFDLQHYTSEYKKDMANHILVDLVHLNANNSSFSVFTDDIFVFANRDNIRYIPVKDMFNFEVVAPSRNYSVYTRFSVDDVIVRTDCEDILTGYSRFRVSHRIKNGVMSDAVRIRKKDGIVALKISGGNPKYNYALHIMYNDIEGNMMSYASDTGWAACNSVKTYDLTSLFEKYSDTLYILPFIRFSDDSAHVIKDVENLELTVEPIYANQSSDSPIIDLDTMLSDEFTSPSEWATRGRGYITDFIPFNATQCIRVSSNVVTTRNYNGKNLSNILAFHGYDKNKKMIFDGYWYGNILTSSFGYSPLKYWDNRYKNNTSVQSKEALIEQLAYCKIFIGTDGYTNGTKEDYKNYIDMFINDVSYGLKYVSRDEGLFDYNMVDSNNIITAYSRSSGNYGGAVDNIVALRDEFIFNASSGQPNCKSIEVPEGYRAFNVEFTAKVVGDGAYGYVRAGGQTIHVNNKTYKRFKFRVNKAENIGVIVTPGLTIGSGDLYIKDVKVVPLREDIQVLPHTNNRFYMHRGYSTVYPENSLLAAEEACKRGCSMVELDLFSSTDNKPLFVHDDTIGRTDRNRPTITLSDSSIFTVNANNKMMISGSNIAEFEVNDKLVINDNGVDKTAKITNVSGNIVTVNITNLTGPINSIVNHRRYINTFTEAEFLACDIGTNSYPEEYNAGFADYLNVLSRYNASFIMDIRQLTEACFKDGMAPLMDRFKYWDNVYFMHTVAAMANYDKWAGDLGRKIRTAAILWSSGDTLLQEINTYGAKEYPNTISKDVVLNSPNVTQEAIDLAHSYGMRVMVFTINTVNSAQHFFRMGVDICASDCLSDDNCILW